MSGERIPVVIAAADIESGVTSWALRFRDACRDHPLLDVAVINCWETGRQVGSFDATITTESALRRYLIQRPGAIVVPNFVWEAVPVCADLARQGHPVHTMAYLHANSEKEYYAPARWLEPILGGFLCASDDIAARLTSMLPHRADEISILPCAVEVPAMPPQKNFDGTLRLIYGGRLVQEIKRVFDLVSLVEYLLKLDVPFSLTIVGPGPDRDALREKVGALPHEGRVRLLDAVPIEQMPALWAQHDVFIQTSETEGTSCSMLEAMAQGCIPCVTDASSSVRQIVTPASGFIVPVGDMAAMAASLHQLSQDPPRIAAMSIAAHAAAIRFGMQPYIERFASVAQRISMQPARTWPAGNWHELHWGALRSARTPLATQRRFLKPSLFHRAAAKLFR